jgi:hypothetical protein
MIEDCRGGVNCAVGLIARKTDENTYWTTLRGGACATTPPNLHAANFYLHVAVNPMLFVPVR